MTGGENEKKLKANITSCAHGSPGGAKWHTEAVYYCVLGHFYDAFLTNSISFPLFSPAYFDAKHYYDPLTTIML